MNHEQVPRWRRGTRVFPELTAALTLCGLLLYGVMYWFHDGFWGEFGLAADEVGLNPTVLLPRVAVGTVFVGVLIAPSLLAANVLPTVTDTRGPLPGVDRRKRSGAVGLLSVVVAAGISAAILTAIDEEALVLFVGFLPAAWLYPLRRQCDCEKEGSSCHTVCEHP